MIARLLVRASLLPIELIYRAWGRWWIDDDECRWLVTTIMRVTLWLARRPGRAVS